VGALVIIGHGDLASVIPDRPDRLFFAAGVSNSQERRESEYHREIDLLREQDHTAHIVYFSSLCVFYGRGRYADHKRVMEHWVKAQFERYAILRLGNITWGKNPTTLINHLRASAAAGLPLDVQDVYRYIVDKDEFRYWLNMIPPWSCELNIPGRRMLVADVVREYVPGVYWNGEEWAKGNVRWSGYPDPYYAY
jgi:hypothetical protein